jgi:hypothetical protein
MDTATKQAMGVLIDQTAQMRHEAVGEISDRVPELINEIAVYISRNYIVIDKQTDEKVGLCTHKLMGMIGEDQWGEWQHGLTELLEFNDDVTLDRMQQIVESQHPRSAPVRPTTVPVGRIPCINVLDALVRISNSQQAILRSAIDYLGRVPEVVDQNTAAQEAKAIAKMKHYVYAQWTAEARKASQLISMLTWAHGNGLGEPATDTIQELLAGMDLNQGT